MDRNSGSTAPTNSSPSPATTTTSVPPAATRFSTENSNGSSVCGAGSGRSTTTSSSNHMANSLRALNKSSYKVSKPISRNPNPNLNSLHLCPPASSAMSAAGVGTGPQQQQPQPPVYNIDKNDFRDVVQKLTGSPAHLSSRPLPPSVSTTSPLQPPNRPSVVPQPLSRLHRIRPPPLAQLSSHPPTIPAAASTIGECWIRPPLSPLPPFPTISAAAESPISAYMRRLHSGQPLLAPSSPGMAPQHHLLPLSPLAFGCAPSPRTAVGYQFVMSPTFQFPTSPGLPIPSPK